MRPALASFHQSRKLVKGETPNSVNLCNYTYLTDVSFQTSSFSLCRSFCFLLSLTNLPKLNLYNFKAPRSIQQKKLARTIWTESARRRRAPKSQRFLPTLQLNYYRHAISYLVLMMDTSI